MKKINLAKALCNNKKCIGYAWKIGKNRYDYQNDNDLGLDLECINCELEYSKKIYVGHGYYFYLMKEYWYEENGDTIPPTLSMVTLLLKECNKHILPLTPREERRLAKYWGRF